MIVNCPWTCREDRRNFAVALALDHPVKDLCLASCDPNLPQLSRRGDRLGRRALQSAELLGAPMSQCDVRSRQVEQHNLFIGEIPISVDGHSRDFAWDIQRHDHLIVDTDRPQRFDIVWRLSELALGDAVSDPDCSPGASSYSGHHRM